MSRFSFSQGYNSFVKQAGLLNPFGVDISSLATSMNVNTDTRNVELDRKLDAILEALSNKDEKAVQAGKVKITGEDANAKAAIRRKRKLIAEALQELSDNGTI